MVAFVLCLALTAFAKEGKVEGVVVRRNADKNTITVRVRTENNVEKIVNYDSSTKFNAAYHGKKPSEIKADEIKDGDQVICLGSYDDKGDFHATMVSKRLSHSPE